VLLSSSTDLWQSVRTSLRDTGDRFTALVSAVHSPDETAVGRWSVAETAAHVATVAWMYTSLLSHRPDTHPIPGMRDHVHDSALDEVGALNDLTLGYLPERDPAELAVRIRIDIGRILAATADSDPAAPVSWLGGARLPVAGWCAHLVNEMLIHGHDIASATGSPWRIPQHDAALAFEVFLVGLLRSDTGRLLSHEPVTRQGAAVRFRSRYTTPVVLTARDGRISVHQPEHPADLNLYFRPAALMLTLFGRLGMPRATLTGQLAVWGPRVWRLRPFLRSVRFP
jgi:uncharacterized protein (TIGR03083 family)